MKYEYGSIIIIPEQEVMYCGDEVVMDEAGRNYDINGEWCKSVLQNTVPKKLTLTIRDLSNILTSLYKNGKLDDFIDKGE